MYRFVIPVLSVALLARAGELPGQAPDYEIRAIRYGTIPDFPASVLVRGADEQETLDIAMVFWLIQSDERVILFDSGFHRPSWFERFEITDFVAPDSAVRLAGVQPEDVTDLVISHAHWDHMGGIDLFSQATLWIQEAEFAYYTGPAWADGGRGGGSDPNDVIELVRRNTMGGVHLIDGDNVEILPGVRVYTGARHTYASQYLRIAGDPPIVLASDNAYLYRNLNEHRPVATFAPEDTAANLAAFTRMLDLAHGIENVVPGHDPLQFERFPSSGRVARIR